MFHCIHYVSIDGIIHECKLPSGHEGEHQLRVTDSIVSFDALDDEQISTITNEENETLQEFPYTQDDIRRALYRALCARIEELQKDLAELIGDSAYTEYLELLSDRRHVEAATLEQLRDELRAWTKPGTPYYLPYRQTLRCELAKRLNIALDGNKTDKLLLGDVLIAGA